MNYSPDALDASDSVADREPADLIAIQALDWMTSPTAVDWAVGFAELARWNAGLPMPWQWALMCPKCRSEGKIGKGRVPGQGNPVVCPNCGHSWVVKKSR